MAKPTNIVSKSTTQRVDLEEATIRIYRAEQPPAEPDGEPGPLDGKRVMKVSLAPGLTPYVEELPPALDAQVDQVLSRAAAEHGLSKEGS